MPTSADAIGYETVDLGSGSFRRTGTGEQRGHHLTGRPTLVWTESP
jgi:hypothetical protein